MNKILTTAMIGALGLGAVGNASALELAAGARISTLGAGVEGVIGVSDTLNARIGANAWSRSVSESSDGIDYDFDIDLQTVALIADWHPFGNGFRVSLGVMQNGNDISGDAETQNSYTVGNNTYTGTQIGTLSADVDFEDVAPYVGIGWGNALDQDGRLSFNAEVGVLFQGSPKVDLTTTGSCASNAACLADLQREEDDLQNDLDSYDKYPVVAIGLTYRF